MLTTILATAALAAVPAGARQTASENDCTFYALPANSNGVEAIHVECEWPEVTVVTLDNLLHKWANHQNYFSAVGRAQVLETKGDVSRVHQRHVAAGISDREITLDMWRETVDKGYRYAWKGSANQHTKWEEGNVSCPVDEGAWTVVALPRGGVKVNYDLLYDPGGWVPGFVVRSFQTGGIVTMLAELRAQTTAR